MRVTLFVAMLAAVVSCTLGCGGNVSAPIPQRKATEATAVPYEPPVPVTGVSYDNPLYALWKNFPVGATVVTRTTTENEDNPKKTVTTTRCKIIAKSADQVEYESQATTNHWSGDVTTNPTERVVHKRTFMLPQGMTPPQPKKDPANEGEETLKIAGLTIKTNWSKSNGRAEHGELISQVWSSPDVPGQMVKSVSTIPAQRATITIELIELNVPKS